MTQSVLLDQLAYLAVTNSEIERPEIAEKEHFRQRIEAICRETIGRFEHEHNQVVDFPFQSVELKCFGSLSSGFATKGSDMDLGLLSPLSVIQPDAAGSPIPRLLEKAFLDAGIGARLLSRTRVPIIKLCENPPEQLRKGLLEAREQWEQGSPDDANDAQDETEVGGEDQDGRENELGDESQPPESPDAASTWFQLPSEDGKLQWFHLEQGTKQSFPNYVNLAKRVLRKAGGRDVVMSNFREFTPRDWDILESVCRAFVNGIRSQKLRELVQKFPSLTFGAPGSSNQHSLAAVCMQVEGEDILMQWVGWKARPLIRSRKVPADHFLREWDDLQHVYASSLDPVAFTKEIQALVEKMRKIPAIQLMLLEQSQTELPSQYLSRIRIILRNLEIRWEEIPLELRQEILHKYVSGVQPEQISKALVLLLEENAGDLDLESLGRKHMALTLALELERALDKGSYPEEYCHRISQYTTILRSPLMKIVKPTGEPTLIVPIPTPSMDLVAWVKTLQDPHKLPPNATGGKYKDPLEFPKSGAGTQCDINFSAHLALQNTLLLRCYSQTDPRVRPIVLFIKHWAKARGINSGYRGTMSSYGYVLMVLHYLVNIADPPVCPNLQLVQPPGADPQAAVCKGYNVYFWRDEQEILRMAMNGQLSPNTQSIGHLLRGFFEYYAQSGNLSTVPGKGFDWGRDVISLRTQGGLLSKQSKGWTGAKTVYQAQESVDAGSTKPEVGALAPTDDGSQSKASAPNGKTEPPKADGVKEVRLRYLCAIEDPFELEHNVARTVTHNGIVSIRDELRRAWRVIQAAGQGIPHDELLQDVNAAGGEEVNHFVKSINEIHGLNGQ